MSVKAKFYVSSLNNPEGATAAQVTLHAVCRGIENAMWAQATPAGSITMHVKNDPAFEQFEQGAEYEVIFTKVAKPTAGDGHQIVEAVDMHGRVVCETCGAQLGYTEAAVEAQPYLAQWATPEYREQTEAQHRETFGA